MRTVGSGVNVSCVHASADLTVTPQIAVTRRLTQLKQNFQNILSVLRILLLTFPARDPARHHRSSRCAA